MPLHLPFNLPYFFYPRYRNNYTYSNNISPIPIYKKNNFETKKEGSSNQDKTLNEESSELFFEIFGLKLYFDDILIIALLFLLYSEGIQDQELFICLLLLLLS